MPRSHAVGELLLEREMQAVEVGKSREGDAVLSAMVWVREGAGVGVSLKLPLEPPVV